MDRHDPATKARTSTKQKDTAKAAAKAVKPVATQKAQGNTPANLAESKQERTKPAGKPVMGRPTAYKAEYADQALKLCRLGATDKELADFFGVSEQTVNAWKHRHPDFLESLKAGKGLADAEVADKLFRRATGYEHKAVKIVADAKTGAEHQVQYTERYPPDTTAAIFWLKNRRPDLWRDRIDNTHSGPDGGAIQHGIAVTFVKTGTAVGADDDDADGR